MEFRSSGQVWEEQRESCLQADIIPGEEEELVSGLLVSFWVTDLDQTQCSSKSFPKTLELLLFCLVYPSPPHPQMCGIV